MAQMLDFQDKSYRITLNTRLQRGYNKQSIVTPRLLTFLCAAERVFLSVL